MPRTGSVWGVFFVVVSSQTPEASSSRAGDLCSLSHNCTVGAQSFQDRANLLDIENAFGDGCQNVSSLTLQLSASQVVFVTAGSCSYPPHSGCFWGCLLCLTTPQSSALVGWWRPTSGIVNSLGLPGGSPLGACRLLCAIPQHTAGMWAQLRLPSTGLASPIHHETPTLAVPQQLQGCKSATLHISCEGRASFNLNTRSHMSQAGLAPTVCRVRGMQFTQELAGSSLKGSTSLGAWHHLPDCGQAPAAFEQIFPRPAWAAPSPSPAASVPFSASPGRAGKLPSSPAAPPVPSPAPASASAPAPHAGPARPRALPAPSPGLPTPSPSSSSPPGAVSAVSSGWPAPGAASPGCAASPAPAESWAGKSSCSGPSHSGPASGPRCRCPAAAPHPGREERESTAASSLWEEAHPWKPQGAGLSPFFSHQTCSPVLLPGCWVTRACWQSISPSSFPNSGQHWLPWAAAHSHSLQAGRGVSSHAGMWQEMGGTRGKARLAAQASRVWEQDEGLSLPAKHWAAYGGW